MARRKRPPKDSVFSTATKPSGKSYLPAFLQYLDAECGLAQNTRRAYGTDLEQFFQWFEARGRLSLHDVDLSLLTEWMEHLRERDLKTTSIARHLVSLKMFFRYLVLEGILLESSVELLSSPKLWQYLPKVLSPTKVDALLSAPQNCDQYPLRDRALLCLLYATGCRASEVANMKLTQLHLDEHFCRCVGKGNKERLVSLNPVAEAALQTYLTHERPDLANRAISEPEWLLLTRSGRRLSRLRIWHLVKKYAARIGCSEDVSPHTLRHSFATHMLAGGAEIRALQEILGHASIATTQKYTHVDHSRLKTIHQKYHPRG